MVPRLAKALGMGKTAIAAILLFSTPAAAFPVSRCMNLGAALEAPVEGDWGYVIEEAHLGVIARAGFDTIRLPARFSEHWDGTRVDPAFLARVDEVIGWARAEGLTIILDLHHFEELMADPAAHAGTLRDIWAFLSDHYAGAPDDLVFELLNEPADQLTTAKAAALYAAILADLRSRHPDRWVILGGAEWNSLDELPNLGPAPARVVHTFHFYEPWPFTHQQAVYLPDPPPARSWGTAEDRAELDRRLTQAAAHPAPLFLGEFGVYDATDPAAKLAWVRAVRQAAEARGIPWCYWGFTQGREIGFSAYDVNSDRWIDGMLQALTD